MTWGAGEALAQPELTFVGATPADGATVVGSSVEIEVDIVESALASMTFNWNGTDYVIHDDSTVLMFNFDNVADLLEDYSTPGGLVKDLSSWENNGTVGIGDDPTSVPEWLAEGRYGGAFDFAGDGNTYGQSILVIPHDSSLNPGSGDFAIAVWVLPRSDIDGDILRKGSTDTASTWYKLEHSPGTANDKFSLNFNTDGTDATVNSPQAYNDDQWHFVVAQRRGGSAELWIDGYLVGSASVSGSISNEANLTVGSKDTQADDFINATLDEVRVYMRSFTEDQMQVLYNSNLSGVDLDTWYFYVNQTNLANGTYTYQASATNASLETGTAGPRTLTVDVAVPPTVTLVSPADGSVLNDPTVTFTVDAADPASLVEATLYVGTPEQVVTFSGPTETDDAQITADTPDVPDGGAASINVDGQTPHAHAVIKFPHLIGTGPGQVPLNTTVVSATLQLNCTNPGATMQVYRLTSDWAEDAVTWNSPWANPGGDYDPAVVVNGDCTVAGLRTIDITEFVQAWANGTDNYGILLTDTGTDGVDFDSSEGANPPMLTVVYAGDWQPMQTQTLSGNSDTATFTDIVLQDLTDYVWNCLVTNAAVPPMSGWAAEDFNLSIDGQTPYEPVLVGPADGATAVGIPATLEVTVSDPQSEDLLDVTFYGRKKTSAGEDFTIVVLPDTQKYAESYPDIFTAQTQWIIDNKDALNVVFVIHEGDIVNVWNSTTQWDRANISISLLDGVVPYSVVPGDHDHYGEDPVGSTEYYEQYFPASRFSGYSWWGGSYAGNFGGSYDETYPHTNNNNYQLHTIGGQDYIFLSLDFCPSQDEIDWANGVLTTYSDRKAILTTHALLDTNADYKGTTDFWLYPDGTSNPTGDTSLIWYDLIRNHENLQLVLCGHMHGEARRTDDNLAGKPVHQLLANYQGRTNGGNGWLRIMTFVPAEDKVYVETYSPWLNEYETDASSQFELDMPLGGYAEIGTNFDVPSGSSTSVDWTDLQPGTAYEWFVEVSDGTNIHSGPTWQFTTEGNQSPVANDDSATTDEDTAVIIDVLANDVDADYDPLTVVSVTQGTNGSVVINADETVTYTPNPNFSGSDSFTYWANDGFSNSNAATVTITVVPVNDEPVADNDSASTQQGIPITIDVLANDTDVEGDTLTVTNLTQPSNGTATVNADETVNYTPDSGFTGSDSFTYTAYDGSATSNVATVSVTVNPLELELPWTDGFESGDFAAGGWTKKDGDATVHKSAAYTGTYGARIKATSWIEKAISTVGFSEIHVKCNWRPRAGGSQSAVCEWSIDGSTWTILAESSSTSWSSEDWTCGPGADSNSAFRVRFRGTVPQGNNEFYVDDVEITGTASEPGNNPPVANDDSATTDEDTVVTINVLANDSDADGDTVSVASVTQGANGSVTNNTTSVTYTPNANFNGTDTFTYTISDGKGGSDTATVTITVNAINDPPVANNDAYSMTQDTTLSVAAPGVLGNDTDADNDTLTAMLVSDVSSGTLTLNADGSFTYTPTSGFTGSDNFSYTANDGTVNSNTATVTITVNPAGGTTMHVGSISVYKVDLGKGEKKGRAEVIILDDSGAAVSGATVTGTFSEDISETVSATSDSSGLAVLDSTSSVSGRCHLTFCVDDVVLVDTPTYDPEANVETCDSNH